TADVSEAQFASNITKLASAPYNCQIITDDVAYFDEPMFQDGIVAQAIDNAVTNNGVSYFSAAGNNSNHAYESTSVNFASAKISAISNQSRSYYAFAPGVYQQSITIPAGYSAYLVLQWDQPYYTTNGVTTTLDMYLLNSSGSRVVASATTNAVQTQ